LDIGVVRGVLGLDGITEDRSSEPVRGVEVAFREPRECGRPIVDLSIRDAAAICHGYLE
jgi:hypothetical protein